MKCTDLQFILPLYSDDALSETELAQVSGHLDRCPLCRQKVIDFQEIRNGFRSVPRPEFSAVGLQALRSTIADRLASATRTPLFQLVGGDRRRWLDVWLMPYAVGSLTTLTLGFTMLWIVVTGEIRPLQSITSNQGSSSNTTILVPYVAPDFTKVETDLSPMAYAISRSDYSGESPSINPQGSLVELTRILVRNEVEDEEVTVVADVYGNGVAEITEVVEPSSDTRAIGELQKALNSDASFAAFVPASFDHRSETIRVVLKIQSVSVNTSLR
ncbi:MAG: zf-HC2 domain-containing protein [Pyrinomonadaceae bacterium]